MDQSGQSKIREDQKAFPHDVVGKIQYVILDFKQNVTLSSSSNQ